MERLSHIKHTGESNPGSRDVPNTVWLYHGDKREYACLLLYVCRMALLSVYLFTLTSELQPSAVATDDVLRDIDSFAGTSRCTRAPGLLYTDM